METYLIPACILLALTNLSFALLALSWKRKAAESERHAMGMALELSRTSRASHDAAWDACKRHMLGLIYRVVAKAEREERDAWAALKEISAQAAIEEPIVQVPESV